MTTPQEAISGQVPSAGEPLFDEEEVAIILARLDYFDYVIVPKEPTLIMVDAGARANENYYPKFKSIYRAMISAYK